MKALTRFARIALPAIAAVQVERVDTAREYLAPPGRQPGPPEHLPARRSPRLRVPFACRPPPGPAAH